MPDQPYQSLYRRYRPQRFGEVRGQDHVTRALRNAVRDGRVAHAYLFSGPRGTGKTSTARILAKALNCTALSDGEPCCLCDSCVSARAGTLVDVFELDAASNRGIDRIRELISGVALGTPGERKVYIVDEVHMLTPDASAALLKTLEEPPAHVVFVLATTDAQKVLPTIRSRTQHFEFRLFSPDLLIELLGFVNQDASLGLASDALELAVRRGRGSARDALSVLEQVAAAGQVEQEPDTVDELMEALCERDSARALVAVEHACAAGHDPRVLAESVLEHLRYAFLAVLAPGLSTLPDAAARRASDHGKRLGAAAVVRAMDVVGEGLTDMREALDPRVSLEIALVRLTRPEVDVSPAALLERIERLERAGVPQAEASAQTQSAPAPQPTPTPPPVTPVPTRGAPKPPAPSAAVPAGEPASAGPLPSRDDVTQAWGDTVLSALPPPARARLRGGRFIAMEEGTALYALPNQMHVERSQEFRVDAEKALSKHFGVKVGVRLVVDDRAGTAPPPELPAEHVEPGEIGEEASPPPSPGELLKQAFPGAEEVRSS